LPPPAELRLHSHPSSSDVIVLVEMLAPFVHKPSGELALSSETEDINVFNPNVDSLSVIASLAVKLALLPMVVPI